MSPELNQFPSIQGNNLNKEKKVVPDDFVDKNPVSYTHLTLPTTPYV